MSKAASDFALAVPFFVVLGLIVVMVVWGFINEVRR